MDYILAEQDYGLVVINPEKPTPSKSNNLNGQTLNVNSSTEVIIDCSANGIPSPEILWFKDGQNYSVSIKKAILCSFLYRIWFKIVNLNNRKTLASTSDNPLNIIGYDFRFPYHTIPDLMNVRPETEQGAFEGR